MRRLTFGVLFVGCTASVLAAEPQHAALRRACEYLWSQQAADGGWHSEQYSMLRSGQALTPFVLHALLEVPESIYPRPAGGVERALDFIRNHVDEHGVIGTADADIVEYPVYSTAYAVECFVKTNAVGDDADLVFRMTTFLADAQFRNESGFHETDAAFGGWGFNRPLQQGQSGHMDLAHTRRALDALASVDRWNPSCIPFYNRPGTIHRAEKFLRVVQKHPDDAAHQLPDGGRSRTKLTTNFDGGFYFSPVAVAANKGREETGEDGAAHFRSYATATCDGILALLAAGVPRDDERLESAVEWLAAHDDLAFPQGVPTDYPEPWGEAIRFYHYAVRAEAYAALGWTGDWREQLTALVAKTQATDGSFRNTASPLMKEDDPLLCTALAVVALGNCVAPAP